MSRSEAGSEAGSLYTDSATSKSNSATSVLKKSASLEDGLFGVLYTLSKDRKAPSTRTALAIMFIESLQLLVFVLNPRFPWGNTIGDFVDQIRNLQLQNPVVSLGYNLYLATFWILTALLVSCFGICLYVAYSFRENRFTLVWPIVFVRQVVGLLITTLFTSSLNVFLTSFDCKFIGTTKPYLMSFGGTTDPATGITTYAMACWEMPHAFTAVAGVIVSAAFTSFALLVSMVDFDPDLRSRNPKGSADALAEAIFFAGKTTLAVINVMLSSYTMVLAVSFAVITGIMTGTVVWLLPYRESWVNRVRAGLFATIFFSSCVLIAVVMVNNPASNFLVLLEVCGILPAFAIGWWAVAWREDMIDGRRLFMNSLTAAMIRTVGSGLAAGGGAGGPGGSFSSGAGSGARGDGGSGIEGDGTQDSQRLNSMQRQGSLLAAIVRVGWSAGDASTASRTPFTTPEQVERATRFVASVDAYCQLPTEVVHSIGRLVGASRTAAKTPARAAGGAGGGTGTPGTGEESPLPFDLPSPAGSATGPGSMGSIDYLGASGASGGGGGGGLPGAPRARARGGACSRACAWLRDLFCGGGDATVVPFSGADVRSAHVTAEAHQRALQGKLARAIEKGDAIFRHGLAIFPDVAALHLAYANFVLAYAGKEAESLAKFHVDRARRLNTNFQDRFLIFLRDTDRKHRAQGEAVGDQQLDLISYVEFQSNMEAAINTHRATLKAIRRFWKLLLVNSDARRVRARDKEAAGGHGHGDDDDASTASKRMLRASSAASVGSMDDDDSVVSGGHDTDSDIISFRLLESLSHAFARIDHLESKCASIYQLLLEKYPRSIKLLRVYSAFATEILNDRKKATRVLGEASRLEDVQKDAAKYQKSRSDAIFGNDAIVDPGADGLVVISDKGIIRSVNKHLSKIFGYTEKELVGRNVSILMGPPHAAMHNAYISNYLTTGVAHVLGQKRRVEGKHKDGHTLALELAVSQVENEQGISFAGVIHKMPEEALSARIMISKTGIIQSVNAPVLRMFGYSAPIELLHKNITMLMPSKYAVHHDEWLRAAAEGRGKGIEGVAGRRLEGLHRNGFTFPITVEVATNGTGDAMMYEGVITELSKEFGLITIHERGEILSVNSGALLLYGYKSSSELLGRNVSMLMPEPYCSFHNSYLLRYVTTGKASVIGKQRFVTALHRDGTTFPVSLSVSELKDKDADAGGDGAARPGGILSKSAGAASKKAAPTKKPAGGAGIRDADGDTGEGDTTTAAELSGVATAFAAGMRVFMAKIVPAAAETGQEETDPLLGRLVISKVGIIMECNAKCAAMFGYSDPSQLIGRNVSNITPDDVSAQHDALLHRYVSDRSPRILGTAGRQLFGKKRDGSLMPISLRVHEYKAGPGHEPFYPHRERLPVPDVPRQAPTGGDEKTLRRRSTKGAMNATGGMKSPFGGMPFAAMMAAGAAGGGGMGGCPVVGVRRVATGDAPLPSAELFGARGGGMGMPMGGMGGCPVVGMRRVGTGEAPLTAAELFSTPAGGGRGSGPASSAPTPRGGGCPVIHNMSRPDFSLPISGISPAALGGTTPVMRPDAARSTSFKPTSIFASPGAGSTASATPTRMDPSGSSASPAASPALPPGHPPVPTGAPMCPFAAGAASRRGSTGSTAAPPVVAVPSGADGRPSPADGADAARLATAASHSPAPDRSTDDPASGMESASLRREGQRLGTSLQTSDAGGSSDAESSPDGTFPGLATHGSTTTGGSGFLTAGLGTANGSMHVSPGQMLTADYDGFEGFIYALEDLEALITIDNKGIMLSVNEAACIFFGYWEEEMVGHNVKMLMPADIAEVHDDYLSHYKSSGVKKLIGNRRQVEGRHRDGAALKLLIEIAERKVTLRPGEGETLIFVGRIVLATQSRNELEVQARAALKRITATRRKARIKAAKKEAADAESSDDGARSGKKSKTRRSHTSTAIPTAVVPGEAARRSVDLARARGLIERRDGVMSGATAESSGGEEGSGKESGSQRRSSITEKVVATAKPGADSDADGRARIGTDATAASPARSSPTKSLGDSIAADDRESPAPGTARKGVRFAGSDAETPRASSRRASVTFGAVTELVAPVRRAGTPPPKRGDDGGGGDAAVAADADEEDKDDGGVTAVKAAPRASSPMKPKELKKAGDDDDDSSAGASSRDDQSEASFSGSSTNTGDSSEIDSSLVESDVHRALYGGDNSTEGSSTAGSTEISGGAGPDASTVDETASKQGKTAAEAQSSVQSSFAVRQRERQLRNMSRHHRISSTAARLSTAGAWVLVVMAFIIAVPYAVMETIVQRQKTEFQNVVTAVTAAQMSMSVGCDLRRLFVAAEQLNVIANASASSPLWQPSRMTSTHNVSYYTSQYDRVQRRMYDNALQLDHHQVELHTAAASATSGSLLLHIFASPLFLALKFVDVADGYTTLLRTGLWDLGRSYSVLAQAASKSAALIEVTTDLGTLTAANVSTLPVAAAAASAGAALSSRIDSTLIPSQSYNFILSNAPDAVSTAWTRLAVATSESASASEQRILLIQIVVFVLQLIAPGTLLLLLLRPLLLRVSKERAAMFRVFSRIPADLVSRLSRLTISVGEAVSEDDSSDDEDPALRAVTAPAAGAGTGIGGNHHHHASGDGSPIKKAHGHDHPVAAHPPAIGPHGVSSVAARRSDAGHSAIAAVTHLEPQQPPAKRRMSIVSFFHSLTHIPPRLMLAVGSVAFLVLAMFLCGYLLVQGAVGTGDHLRVAGIRGMLATRVKFFAQELVVSAAAHRASNGSDFSPVTVSAAYTASSFGSTITFGSAASSLATSTHVLESTHDGTMTLPDYIAYSRLGLLDAAYNLKRYHAALLYGDAGLDLPADAMTQSEKDLLFQPACLRASGKCLPTTHPYSRITTSGLHALLTHFVDQAQLLANETIPSLSADRGLLGSTPEGVAATAGGSGVNSGFAHARYDFIWSVAENDLLDGLNKALSLYLADSNWYSRVYSIANGIVFGAVAVALLMVYYGLFRPYIGQITAESNRAAALLRSLPADVDLSVLQHAAGGHGGGSNTNSVAPSVAPTPKRPTSAVPPSATRSTRDDGGSVATGRSGGSGHQ